MLSLSSTPRKLGLSLSGGGYRASAFHLGTLKKLNELEILSKVDVMSTVSGGSVTGAAWCAHKGDYPSFHKKMCNLLNTKSVMNSILTSGTVIIMILSVFFFLGGIIYLTFTRWSVYAIPLIIILFYLFFKFQFILFPISRVIEKAYNNFFYDGKTLSNLKEKPLLAIGSSNLHTGTPFTFSGEKMSDSTYAYEQHYDPPIHFKHDNFPIARAVAASGCAPFAFTPIEIAIEFFEKKEDFSRIKPMLVDGGVYDNQGIQKLTQSKSLYECGIIITSDAGGSFIADKKYPNTIALLIRTVSLFMHRIKNMQIVDNIYKNVNGAAKPIAYFSLGWRIQNSIPGFIQNMIDGHVLKEVIDAHALRPEWVLNPEVYAADIKKHLESRVDYAAIEKRDLTNDQWDIARNTPTGLNCLSNLQLKYLIIHAENLTELQVKLYCPSLI